MQHQQNETPEQSPEDRIKVLEIENDRLKTANIQLQYTVDVLTAKFADTELIKGMAGLLADQQ